MDGPCYHVKSCNHPCFPANCNSLCPGYASATEESNGWIQGKCQRCEETKPVAIVMVVIAAIILDQSKRKSDDNKLGFNYALCQDCIESYKKRTEEFVFDGD